ncbi:hypothetical protein CVT24_012953 [Panaeolus cyanescens]|uniref:Uncharacterized protein n=1 Tax=Panaeolus cyanescens TaxID=181874 RepID=A0A409W6C0_9AGAR|nr:hypothetical protein CVT24_012953 [Panaeolus cyanescens]
MSITLNSLPVDLDALFNDFIHGDYVMQEPDASPSPAPSSGTSRFSGIRMEDFVVDGCITPSRPASPVTTKKWKIDPVGAHAQYNKLWKDKWMQPQDSYDDERDPLPDNSLWCCPTPWLSHCSLTDEPHLLPVVPLSESSLNGAYVDPAYSEAPVKTVDPMQLLPMIENRRKAVRQVRFKKQS